MHTAMLKIRGMSLHRYLRLRRLWAVRGQLLAGDKALQITACALSNGFGHLGEFAALYAAQFWRSTVDNSGSLAAAAIMKNGATDRIPALDWAQSHGLPSDTVKITRN
jgi:AraC-like DNA-binding protein